MPKFSRANAQMSRWTLTIYPEAKEAVEAHRDDEGTFHKAQPAVPQWVPPITLPAGVRYFIGKAEDCPTTGRMHYQSYVEVFVKSQHRAVAQLLGLSPRHYKALASGGTAEENVIYITKEESTHTPLIQWTFGKPAKSAASNGTSGYRSDLAAVAEKVKSGVPLEQIAREDVALYIRIGRNIDHAHKRLHGAVKPITMREHFETHVRWGNTGCGKTTTVEVLFGEENIFKWCHDDGHWQDHFKGTEDVLLIDEFDGTSNIPIRLFKMLCRGNALTIPRRDGAGGPLSASWTKVFVTSNHHPTTWWHGKCKGRDWDAVSDRFTSITKFTTKVMVDGEYIPSTEDPLNIESSPGDTSGQIMTE